MNTDKHRWLSRITLPKTNPLAPYNKVFSSFASSPLAGEDYGGGKGGETGERGPKGKHIMDKIKKVGDLRLPYTRAQSLFFRHSPIKSPNQVGGRNPVWKGCNVCFGFPGQAGGGE